MASQFLCLAIIMRLPILQALCCKTSQTQLTLFAVNKQGRSVAFVLEGDPKPLSSVTIDEKQGYCYQTHTTAGCCVLSAVIQFKHTWLLLFKNKSPKFL